MTIREIIKQKNREYSEDKLLRRNICREIFTQDATERKIRAAEYFAPVLKEKFGAKYPLLDWEEESAGLAVLCYYGVDDINRDITIIPAIAIFIADSIYHSEGGDEKIRKISNLMSDNFIFDNVDSTMEDSYYEDCEIEALHPFYPTTILENLERHIAMRNLDFINYSKTKSTAASYSFICDRYTSSLKKDNKESETRKVFDSIMDLVPQKDKDEAIEEYKTLFFALIDCYFETRENIEKAKKKYEGRMENLKYSINEEFSEPLDPKEENNSLEYLSRFKEITSTLDKIEFLTNNLNDNYAMGIYATESLRDKYSKPFANVPSFDPYKVIAGYFFLLESGDNYAWLLGASIAPVSYAGYFLPWSDMATSSNICEELEEKVNRHYPNGNDIYLPLIRKEALSINDDFLPDKISIAKAVYLLTNTIIPRFNIEVPEKESVKNEIGDEMFNKLENYLNFNYTTRNKIIDTTELSSWLEDIKKHNELSSELDAVKNRLSTVEDEKAKLEKKSALSPDVALLEEIDSLKDKIKKLNTLLGREEVEKEKLKRKISSLNNEHRNEKEELNSLREIIFTRDENQDDKDDSNVNQGNKHPYHTDINIIVIGGLPDWLKAMKNLLPDVKFFGDRVPDKAIFKHCDIVWFQTYAGLSHKTFYKAVDDAKIMDIPIKYCPTSGVYRSVEAIVKDEDERKRRK